MGKFFRVRNPKIILRRLKNKPVLQYLRFQVLSTCDWTDAEKYMWPDRYQFIIEPKMAFGSLLCSSKWWSNVKYIFLRFYLHSQKSQDRKWITIVKVNLLDKSHRNWYKISECYQLYEIYTIHGVSPSSPTQYQEGPGNFRLI